MGSSKVNMGYPLFHSRYVIALGFAMFSMFFGAGNVIFPLILGMETGENYLWSFLGFGLAAVIMPFLGILTMILFKGDYTAFFGRMGKKLGIFVAFVTVLLLGPFSGTPRCLNLAATTLQQSVPNLSEFWFLLGGSCLLFLLAVKRRYVLGILGYVLTPLLLLSLFTLVVLGIFSPHEGVVASQYSPSSAFMDGIKDGYYTLDLIAAFFFSAMMVPGLEHTIGGKIKEHYKKALLLTLVASLIGASLLAASYLGFMHLSANYSSFLVNHRHDELLGILSRIIVGKQGGLITNMIVSLACLTTALTQVVFVSSFVHKIFHPKVHYKLALGVVILLAFFVSRLGFSKIVDLVSPVLMVIYPALIALCLGSLFEKLTKKQIPVRLLFWGVLLASLFKESV